ncbi:transposase, partial [Candidatus Fukatsuia symbiotica]
IETTGSRTRLNIMGALNIQNVANPIIRDDETINSENVVHFLSTIRAHYPITTTAHVILEGAGYHRSQLVQDAALTLNIHCILFIIKINKLQHKGHNRSK